MPITDQKNGRNFITKIASYKKIHSVPNSMSVLTELLPMMIDMAKREVTGTVNLTNPGTITHNEILEMYKEYVDSNISFELITVEELQKSCVVARRSNNFLTTDVLQKHYPNVKSIKESIKCALIEMGKTMKANF